MNQTELVLGVLELWYRWDLGNEDIHVTFVDPDYPRVWLDCSDSFAWASADAEEVADKQDFDLLVKCVHEVVRHDDTPIGWDVALLYAARKRNLMLMPARFEKVPHTLRELYEGLRFNG